MLVVIKGAGDLASGIALRLYHAGFDIVMTEIAAPLAVRRTVSFSEAVYKGRTLVEDVSAILAKNEADVRGIIAEKRIAVMVDPDAAIVSSLRPAVLVDAIMAKRNTGTASTDAPLVIGVGPGFTAGLDCHAVIETKRGHTLGRVISSGCALPNTGVPGEIGGFGIERLLRAGADGVFEAIAQIGGRVTKGDVVGYVRPVEKAAGDGVPVIAAIDGILRGILPSGIAVTGGTKAGDIDPRADPAHCFTVSDKSLAVGGGVLEAILRMAGGIQAAGAALPLEQVREN
jgi:xanthine dehydrogenase accessory factor